MANTTTSSVRSVLRYARASVAILAYILTLGAQPPDLLRRVAARETENEAVRNDYMYRQTVIIADLDQHGAQLGEYREVRDIVFSPTMVRSEQVVEKARNTLKRLQLTEEDFRDIREIQPLLITRDNLFMYEAKPKGEEPMDGVDCYILQVRPRQILDGQRLFDGMIWVNKEDFSIVRLQGQAVPQIQTSKKENLFPHFTTIRQKVEGNYWFPVTTFADDTLYFRAGPQRIRMTIRYANYKRFMADTKIEYK
jgi:hypothetical protein